LKATSISARHFTSQQRHNTSTNHVTGFEGGICRSEKSVLLWSLRPAPASTASLASTTASSTIVPKGLGEPGKVKRSK
jgi:chorismate synthase